MHKKPNYQFSLYLCRMELQTIQSKIYELRGRRVMLDFDLAVLYGVPTKRLKEQVKRNIERFEGDDFMFELSEEEYDRLKEFLRSQIATLEIDGRGRYPKYAPYAFTESGVAMLSSVLRSATAIDVNRSIIRAFVAMRNYLMTATTMTSELAEMRAKLALLERNDELLRRDNEDTLESVNDLSEDVRKDIDNLYNAIGQLSIKVEPPSAPKPRRRIGYIKYDD